MKVIKQNNILIYSTYRNEVNRNYQIKSEFAKFIIFFVKNHNQ